MPSERYYPILGGSALAVSSFFAVFTTFNVIFGPWPGHLSQKLYGLPFLKELFGMENSQPVWGPTGVWSGQDFMLLAIAAISMGLGLWARRWRPEFVVPTGAGVADQFEMRELSQTSISSSTKGVSNPRTASIVENLIAKQEEVDTAIISGAIGALSKGDFGAKAAETVAEKPPIHGELIPIETESIPLPAGESAPMTHSTSYTSVPIPEYSEEDAQVEASPVSSQVSTKDAKPIREVVTAASSPQEPNVDLPKMVELPPLPKLPSLDSAESPTKSSQAAPAPRPAKTSQALQAPRPAKTSQAAPAPRPADTGSVATHVELPHIPNLPKLPEMSEDVKTEVVKTEVVAKPAEPIAPEVPKLPPLPQLPPLR